jgi:hypothetical protein
MERQVSIHHHVELASPWKHDPVTKVTAYAPAEANDNPDIASHMLGRAVVNVAAGPFDLSLRPTAADLRALAKALLTVAADLDEATAPLLQSKPQPLPPSRRHEAPRAVWPAGLAHLPQAASC